MRAKTRSRIPKSKFASPKGSPPDRSRNQYPVDTKKRAVNAKARATQMHKKGKLSKTMRNRIYKKANARLRRKR